MRPAYQWPVRRLQLLVTLCTITDGLENSFCCKNGLRLTACTRPHLPLDKDDREWLRLLVLLCGIGLLHQQRKKRLQLQKVHR
jgi:hypothetical protein